MNNNDSKKVIETKTYKIEVLTYENETKKVFLNNTGFELMELIGILTVAQSRIIESMNMSRTQETTSN